MRKLYFFKKTWNNGNSVHIDFSQIKKEKWFDLAKAIDHFVIEPPNYKIVNGVVTLNFDLENEYSYIIEVDEELIDKAGYVGVKVFKYWHCYFINSTAKRSGYTILACDTDVWGTFYPDVELYNIHVSRCNRNIGRGRFDTINAYDTTGLTDNWYKAIGGDETTTTGINSLDDTQVDIIFVANCVMAQSGTGKTNATGTFVFANNLSYFKDLADASGVSTLEYACRFVSGITGLKESGWLTDLNASISSVYIVPSAYVTKTNVGFTFTGLTPYTGTTENLGRFWLVKPNLTKHYFDMKVDDLSPNFQWTLGVKDEGLEVLRSTQNELACIETSFNYDGVKILVRQGKEQYDVTNRFAVGVIGKAEQTDVLERINNTIHFVGSMINNLFSISGGVKSYREKGDMGRLAGSITNFTNFLSDATTNRASANTSKSNSDGYLTFNYQNHKLFYPFYLTYKKSAIDEEQHARLYGASFDVTLTWINDLYSYPVFYASDYETTYTFVQAEVEITQAPTDALNFIKGVFAGGVYLTDGVDDTIDKMI